LKESIPAVDGNFYYISKYPTKSLFLFLKMVEIKLVLTFKSPSSDSSSGKSFTVLPLEFFLAFKVDYIL
jgi:hypothetical protein